MMQRPRRIVDAHHHFLDSRLDEGGNGRTFQAFLASLLPEEQYLPAMYDRDVVQYLLQEQANIVVSGSVHVECMPDSGREEVAWVHSMTQQQHGSTVRAMVASCDLTLPTVNEDLTQLKRTSHLMRGVRWILDCVGPYDEGHPTATHVATKRHHENGVMDYLRGGDNGTVLPAFERGYALLERHNLSFDLQCAPAQLVAAATLMGRYPHIPVCINHLGKPRMLLGPDDDAHINQTQPNANELETWRQGMRAMAKLPHVYVKLSMMGYAVPGWMKTVHRRRLLKGLVREVLELFGPRRCMVALNWWKNAAVSDSDCLSDVGPTPLEYIDFIVECMEGYSDTDRDRVFEGTAREFYRISD